MQKTSDILIIGTDPPCPRCDLLGILVKQAAPHLEMEPRHCAFDSTEARELGRRLGRKVGAAKHVSEEAGIPMDWDAVYGLIQEKKSSLEPEGRPADAWTPELDGMLEPCQRAADSAGYLMTPILVVNGRVAHHGSVPSLPQLTGWLSDCHT